MAHLKKDGQVSGSDSEGENEEEEKAAKEKDTLMLRQRELLIQMLMPNETPSQALHRLKKVDRSKLQAKMKKKNIRKSELARMEKEAAAGATEAEMANSER